MHKTSSKLKIQNTRKQLQVKKIAKNEKAKRKLESNNGKALAKCCKALDLQVKAITKEAK